MGDHLARTLFLLQLGCFTVGLAGPGCSTPGAGGCACAPGFKCDGTGACVPIAGFDASAPDDASSGGCVPACSGATPHCSSKGHCAACLADGDCPAGSYCKKPGDPTSTCTPGCSMDAQCGASRRCCAGRCADTAADPANCGACGTVCAAVHATPSCAAGKCGSGGCDPGFGDCNGNTADGCEANLHVDPNNCTACGAKCVIPNAINACADGCYESACQFGNDDCDGNPMNGCETPVLSDPANCGACGNPCGMVPNGTAACMSGACVLGACTMGYANCDGNPVNGCEASLGSDPKNCGGCGLACPMNLPSCGGGKCNLAPVCKNLGWKSGSANWACPQGYRMPTVMEWNAVAPCLTQQDMMTLDAMHDVATVVGGCNCKWNPMWCGQPSIETIRQGRMCGDFMQLHICVM